MEGSENISCAGGFSLMQIVLKYRYIFFELYQRPLLCLFHLEILYYTHLIHIHIMSKVDKGLGGSWPVCYNLTAPSSKFQTLANQKIYPCRDWLFQRVMMQIVQELCKRPGLNKCGFDMPTIYVPNPNKVATAPTFLYTAPESHWMCQPGQSWTILAK